MARANRQRRRIPHGKLLPATSVKSGMAVWHVKGRCFRTVQRVVHSEKFVDLYMSNGVGTTPRRTWVWRNSLVFVRITERAPRVKKQVA